MLLNLLGLFMSLLLNGEAVPSALLVAATPPRRHVVEIREFVFHPKRIVASPGDTVVWINRDVVPHTATASDGTWGSQELQEGTSWEMAVGNSGVQDYFCEFHPHMQGVLEVRLSLDPDFAGRDENSDGPLEKAFH